MGHFPQDSSSRFVLVVLRSLVSHTAPARTRDTGMDRRPGAVAPPPGHIFFSFLFSCLFFLYLTMAAMYGFGDGHIKARNLVRPWQRTDAAARTGVGLLGDTHRPPWALGSGAVLVHPAGGRKHWFGNASEQAWAPIGKGEEGWDVGRGRGRGREPEFGRWSGGRCRPRGVTMQRTVQVTSKHQRVDKVPTRT